MKPFFREVTKRDARLLMAWWRAHSPNYVYDMRPATYTRTNKPKLWNIYRQPI